jgi:dephospho-CoA kinase
MEQEAPQVRRIPVIGLTGGIGAGKSAVAAALAKMGCVVSHSDAEGRAALRDPVIRDTLVSWWGNDVVDDAGEIDRRAVAEIVFNDAEQRHRLEELTHPWIRARRDELFAAAPPDTPALVIDAPLLIEAGLDRDCDVVLFVDAAYEIRRERLLSSRGWDEAELRAREDSQLPLDEKRKRADYVLRNEGDLSELAAQVRSILHTILDSRPAQGPGHVRGA